MSNMENCGRTGSPDANIFLNELRKPKKSHQHIQPPVTEWKSEHQKHEGTMIIQ